MSTSSTAPFRQPIPPIRSQGPRATTPWIAEAPSRGPQPAINSRIPGQARPPAQKYK